MSTFSQARRGSRVSLFVAVAMAALALASCRSSSDVTGSIGNPAAASPDALRRHTDVLARQYDRAPQNKKVAMAYASALRAGGRRGEAVAVLQRLAAAHSNDRAVLAAYGKSLAENGRLAEAAGVLKGAHTPERPDWTVLSAQGSVADQMGDHTAAQGYYASALRIAPGEPSVLSNQGLSFALNRNLPRAEQSLRQAAAHPRADARVRQNLALVLALQGNFAEAEAVQKKDLPAEKAVANVAAIRSMIAQSNTWRNIQSGGARSGARQQAR